MPVRSVNAPRGLSSAEAASGGWYRDRDRVSRGVGRDRTGTQRVAAWVRDHVGWRRLVRPGQGVAEGQGQGGEAVSRLRPSVILVCVGAGYTVLALIDSGIAHDIITGYLVVAIT